MHVMQEEGLSHSGSPRHVHSRCPHRHSRVGENLAGSYSTGVYKDIPITIYGKWKHIDRIPRGAVARRSEPLLLYPKPFGLRRPRPKPLRSGHYCRALLAPLPPVVYLPALPNHERGDLRLIIQGNPHRSAHESWRFALRSSIAYQKRIRLLERRGLCPMVRQYRDHRFAPYKLNCGSI